MRVRNRLTYVRHKRTGKIGRVIVRDKNNIYILWDDQTPESVSDGTAIIARPYDSKFLERFSNDRKKTSAES